MKKQKKFIVRRLAEVYSEPEAKKLTDFVGKPLLLFHVEIFESANFGEGARVIVQNYNPRTSEAIGEQFYATTFAAAIVRTLKGAVNALKADDDWKKTGLLMTVAQTGNYYTLV